MQAGDLQKYQQISKNFKEIIDAITSMEVGQVKLYLVNLQKRIANKQQGFFGEYDSLKHLLDHTKQAKGKVPLHFAAARGNTQIVKFMIQTLNLDHSIKDKQGNNAFFTSIQHGHLDLVKYFVQELNYSPNSTKEGQISCLHLAANQHHTEILQYLISKGADIERVSLYGKPLNWAVGSNSFEATKVLLDHGANPNGDFTGSNPAPLILAVDFNNTDIYKILIEKGADVNVKDPNGYSVLHVAAEKGSLDIVKDLIQRGAVLNLEVQGKSPLYLAFQNKKWDVVNFLKEKESNYQEIEKFITQKLQSDQNRVKNTEQNKIRAQQIKNIGNKLYTDKKYQEALIQYKKALQYDPQNQIIHMNLAACFLAIHKFDEALLHCHYAKRKDSKNVKTIYREAQAYIGLGNFIQASSSLWECSMLQPQNAFFRAEFQKYVELAKQKHKQEFK